MSEKVFEQSEGITTSLAGFTCKPLAVLSETILPQEMSTIRGGDGTGSGGPGSMSSGQPPTKPEQKSWQEAAQKTLEEQKPLMPGLHEGEYVPDYSSYNFDGPGGEGINPIGDAFEWCVNQVSEDLEAAWEDLQDAGEDLQDAWEDVQDAWDWLTGEEEEDEGEEDEGNNDEGSGLPDEENSEEGNDE